MRESHKLLWENYKADRRRQYLQREEEKMQDETHNGWRNYETWLVAAHLDNNRGANERLVRLMRRHNDPCDLADSIRNMVTDNYNTTDPIGLTSAALARVDWMDIARTNLDEYETPATPGTVTTPLLVAGKQGKNSPAPSPH